VEWVALVLLGALILGAAAAKGFERSDRGLGELVAERVVRGPEALGGGGAAPERGPEALGGGGAASERGFAGRRGRVAPRAPAVPRRPAAPRAPTPSRAADAFRLLRTYGGIARHAWVACLGYRRWRYEVEHPLLPAEALPLDEALAIANACLNPYAFLTDD